MDGRHCRGTTGQCSDQEVDARRSPSVSLIIPAHNEEAGICSALEEADCALAELVPDYEIIVVDDGSGDGTAARIAEASLRLPHVRLIRHPGNRGYGAALRTGFEAACGDRVAF